MSSNNDIVGIDLVGFPFNKKYPPDFKRYGSKYHGYKNDVHETFFYDFAVQGYDLRFRYNGKMYYALTESDNVAVCDEHFTNEYQVFKNGNDLIENWIIEGRKLLDIIDECEDVESI